VTTIDINHMERPESWNATMPNGKPLITDKQFAKLMANGPSSLEPNPVPVVKIFLLNRRWLLVWGYPDDPERFFCVAKGADLVEAGEVLLSDIVNARLDIGEFSIGPERDLYIKLNKPWSHYLRNPEAW
jgi:hypothetical protein